MSQSNIVKIFPLSVRDRFGRVQDNIASIREIRMRVYCPVIVTLGTIEYYLGHHGDFLLDEKSAWIISKEEMQEIVNHLCGYSPYAFYEELKRGYITIAGGHRIGVAGQVIIQGEDVSGIKNISFLNIRISHEVLGAADRILPFLYENGQLHNTLIVSPPGFGKTTLLRDVIRQVSDGNAYARGVSVGVVDERSEIAGCFMGVPQNHIGIRTDVLDGCPKTHGMMMLIRSMAPKVVALDELGSKEDVEALKQVVHCGSKILVTIHGQSFEEIKNKPFAREMIQEKYFGRYVILKGFKEDGQVFRLLDEEGRLCLK